MNEADVTVFVDTAGVRGSNVWTIAAGGGGNDSRGIIGICVRVDLYVDVVNTEVLLSFREVTLQLAVDLGGKDFALSVAPQNAGGGKIRRLRGRKGSEEEEEEEKDVTRE